MPGSTTEYVAGMLGALWEPHMRLKEVEKTIYLGFTIIIIIVACENDHKYQKFLLELKFLELLNDNSENLMDSRKNIRFYPNCTCASLYSC